jgi:1-acyl-sn-glycerol-3-phosphate acyltransferase
MYEKHKTIVKIVPGVIIYSLDKKPFISETYAMPRKTNVDVGFGKPITIENYFDEFRVHPEKTVSKLTNIINEEVSSQTNIILDAYNIKNLL